MKLYPFNPVQLHTHSGSSSQTMENWNNNIPSLTAISTEFSETRPIP